MVLIVGLKSSSIQHVPSVNDVPLWSKTDDKDHALGPFTNHYHGIPTYK